MKRAFFLALLPALLPRTAAAQGTPSLKVGYVPTDISGQLFIAKDAGLFQKAGLDAEITPVINGSAIGAAIVSGALDIGYSNPLSLVIAHDKGLPFTVIAAANLYQADSPTVGQLVVLKTGDIASAKDLSGKTIAVGGLNGLVHIAARAWIDANGGDSSSAHYIEMSLPEMPDALRAGRIDAAMFNFGIDPALGKPGDPFRILGNTFTAMGRSFAAGTWFTTSDWVAKHPSETKRFVAVMGEAAQWAAAHPHDAAQIIAANLKEDPARLAAAAPVVFGGAVTPPLLQPVIDMAAKYGVIKSRFAAAELLHR